MIVDPHPTRVTPKLGADTLRTIPICTATPMACRVAAAQLEGEQLKYPSLATHVNWKWLPDHQPGDSINGTTDLDIDSSQFSGDMINDTIDLEIDWSQFSGDTVQQYD